MFRSNQKKIYDIEETIHQNSKKHKKNKSLARNHRLRIQKDINDSKESEFKKRVKNKLSSY